MCFQASAQRSVFPLEESFQMTERGRAPCKNVTPHQIPRLHSPRPTKTIARYQGDRTAAFVMWVTFEAVTFPSWLVREDFHHTHKTGSF